MTLIEGRALIASSSFFTPSFAFFVFTFFSAQDHLPLAPMGPDHDHDTDQDKHAGNEQLLHVDQIGGREIRARHEFAEIDRGAEADEGEHWRQHAEHTAEYVW